MEIGAIVGGRYRLSRELGEGAMGSVWAAEHELLGREVAIKFLRPALEDARTAAARFAAEAKAAAQVKHRFVVDVFDFGVTEQGDSYMVQELLRGQPLSDLMYAGPAWPLRDAVQFMMDCLSGLSAVHERGIVHRDLKPENIFVIQEQEGSVPKLLDFGISKSDPLRARDGARRPSLRAPGRARLTAAGAVLGTPAYMSPEQLRNSSTLDARADLYSLGVVFYEWLAGHCPYASTTNFAELVDQIESRSMELLSDLRPDLGEELCDIVQRALEPDRALRFPSALDMRAALARQLAVLPGATTRVQRAMQPPVKLPPLRVPELQLSPHVALPPPSLPPGGSMRAAPGFDLAKARASAPETERPPAMPSMLSLTPAGMRKGPGLGSIVAVLLLMIGAFAAPFAYRWIAERVYHTAQAKTLPVTEAKPQGKPAPEPRAQPVEPAPVEPAIPLGALPPEAEPEQERAQPALEPVDARKPREEPAHRAQREPARRERATREPNARAAEPRESAPPPAAAPVRAPEPAPSTSPEKSDKLLRSLDF